MYFNYKDCKIYYEKYGKSNKKIIILPGWGDNRKTFNKIIDKYKNNYEIYILDYPGFGFSSIPKEDLTIYNYSEIIISFMKEQKIKKPIIIGHSFGGRIIITLSGYYNIEFSKIVLISSAGIKAKNSLLKKLKQIIYKLLKKVHIFLPNRYRNNYLKKLITIFGSSDYKSLPQSMQKTFINIINEDLTKYLSKIKEDTLLIWGENDTSTPITDAHKMNKLIENSGLVSIKNAGHFSYLEYPNYINLILDKFI